MASDRYYCAYPERAVVAIGGEDRVSFLQALISNDITNLAAGEARWAALLTPQGKYLCDFFVVALADRLLIDVESGRAEDLLNRLRRFKLRAKVALEPLPETRVFLGWGDHAAKAFWFEAPGQGRLILEQTPDQGAAIEEISVFADPRLDRLGIRVIGDSIKAKALLELHEFAPAAFADWDRARLEAGVPDGTRDLIPEQSILLEGGFDELRGVSWTKGCYIGQELTARTKYRALIKKRLLPVRIDGPAPAFGSAILQGGKEAGEMRSSQGNRGLALLRLDALDKGPLTSEEATLTPLVPDWVALPAEKV